VIREPAPHDDELSRLIDRHEGELRALVARHEAEVEAARGAMRLQCELLEAELSDPSSDRESLHRIDAAATVERFEAARGALERSQAMLDRVRDPDAPAAAERVSALEREIERRRSVEADLRSIVATQREDLSAMHAECAPVALASAS
jgi:hypothetical protein